MTICTPQGDVGLRQGAGLVKTIPLNKKGHNEQKGRFKIPKKEKGPRLKGAIFLSAFSDICLVLWAEAGVTLRIPSLGVFVDSVRAFLPLDSWCIVINRRFAVRYILDHGICGYIAKHMADFIKAADADVW